MFKEIESFLFLDKNNIIIFRLKILHLVLREIIGGYHFKLCE